MKKKEFVRYLSEHSGYTIKTSNDMVDVVFENLANAVSEFGDVEIIGFGKFKKVFRKSRKSVDIVNPEKTVILPAFSNLAFKASRVIRARYSAEDKK